MKFQAKLFFLLLGLTAIAVVTSCEKNDIPDNAEITPGNNSEDIENGNNDSSSENNDTADSDATGNDNSSGNNKDGFDGLLSRINVDASAFTASVSGSLTPVDFSQYKSLEIRYGTSYGLSTYSTKKFDFYGLNFDVSLGYLSCNTEYYYRIVAVDNDSKTHSSEIKSFTTNIPKAPDDCTYTIDGKTYKMVKVTGLASGDFYIMQTELPIASSIMIDNHTIPAMDKNFNNLVILAEFREFLTNLRMTTGIEFRLPTSSEWIYAAIGGQNSKGYSYSGSNTLGEVGWYKDNSGNLSHAPAKLKANELGLYDMSGNYGEIVHTTGNEFNVDGDVYGGYYSSTANKCTPKSYISQPSDGYISGTSTVERNAFDGRIYTVRLVYSAR